MDATIERETCAACGKEYYSYDGEASDHICTMRVRVRALVDHAGVIFDVPLAITRSPDREIKARVENARRYIRRCVERHAEPQSPLAVALAQLAGGAHERERDDRVRDAWRERGLTVTSFGEGPEDRAGRGTIWVRVDGAQSWRLDCGFAAHEIAAVENEMASRASSMTVAEQLAFTALSWSDDV